VHIPRKPIRRFTEPTMKNNQTAMPPTPKELLGQLRSLVSDTEELVADSISEHSTEAMNALRERVVAAQERFAQTYDSVRKKVVAGAKCTDSAIRENPYQSLAVAMGVGVLIGVFISRTRNDTLT
jgi:ElaB/YqjD/DUF883 family membrane-anchored ribosome-binding protein